MPQGNGCFRGFFSVNMLWRKCDCSFLPTATNIDNEILSYLVQG